MNRAPVWVMSGRGAYLYLRGDGGVQGRLQTPVSHQAADQQVDHEAPAGAHAHLVPRRYGGVRDTLSSAATRPHPALPSPHVQILLALEEIR